MNKPHHNSEDVKRFLTPKTFESVLVVRRETGFSNVGITSMHNSKREAIRKRSNRFIYHFRWGEPKTLRKPKVQVVSKTCSRCLRTLTFEERKTCFGIDEGFNSDLLQFWNINQVSRATGLSYCALRNACKKGNMMLLMQKDGKIFHLY